MNRVPLYLIGNQNYHHNYAETVTAHEVALLPFVSTRYSARCAEFGHLFHVWTTRNIYYYPCRSIVVHLDPSTDTLIT